jgi:hypothetical protein
MSNLTHTETNNVDIYFVRHAESCSNVTSKLSIGQISHPPLTYKGIQQAINLGINNKIIDQDFDAYYCSPSLRTIMTACLALRQKANTRDPSNPIKIHLNPYLIEKRNITGRFDRQNSIVPIENLKKMIKYVKLWFKEHYFKHNIDYEFVNIIYDLVLLLYYKNNLNNYNEIIIDLLVGIKISKKELLKKLINMLEKEKYIEPIQKFGIINTQNGNDINDIYKNIILFIVYRKYSENLIIYQEQNSNKKLNYEIIIQQLKFFYDEKFFMNNIEIIYDDYDKVEGHNPDIFKFIEDKKYNQNIDKKDYKILCFSHGAILKKEFKLNSKLKNTEILHYNLISGVINRIFNNNIFINKDVELNMDDICGSLHTPKHKMFKVIDNYFSDNKYIISKDDNIDPNFKVIEKEDVLTGGDIYKHKYLKYKHKYLKYKQYLK